MRNFRYIIILTFIVSILVYGTSIAAEKHWVNDELASFKQFIYPVVNTIPVNGIALESEWRLVHTTVLNEETNGYVPRDKAVAGMMKLLHATGKVEARDATDEERMTADLRFNDFNTAFDTSKLAICLTEGFVSGYPDGSFRPKQLLTNSEAVIFISRILD